MSKSSTRKGLLPVILVLGLGILIALYYLSNSNMQGTGIDKDTGLSAESNTNEDPGLEGQGRLAPPSESSAVNERTGNASEGPESEPGSALISIVEGKSGITLEVKAASLDEVLAEFERELGIDVVDLRTGDRQDVSDGEDQSLSFSFSGDLDGMVRFVMNQFGYNYAISYSPAKPASESSAAVKLFVYGPKQEGPDETVAEQNDDLTEGGAGDITPATTGKTSARQEKVNISEVLRSRALSASQIQRPAPAAPPAGNASPVPGVSPSSVAGTETETGITYDNQDEKMEAQLLEMTRKARQEVEALVEGLKEAEKNLKQQSQP